jgi:hypothetical protein
MKFCGVLVAILAVYCVGVLPDIQAADWESDIRLTNDKALSNHSRVAVSGPVVHVVWEDSRDGNEEVYYKRSTDDGRTWSSDVRMSPANGIMTLRPDVAAWGDNAYIVWQDYRSWDTEIYFRKSTDNGATWGAEQTLPYPSWSCYCAAIAVEGNNIHVVYHNYVTQNYEIYHVYSTNGGSTWNYSQNISNNNGDSEIAEIAVSGGFVHVVWQDNTTGTAEVLYNRSTNNGASWGTPVMISPSGANSTWPDIDCYGSNCHIVWQDYRVHDTTVYHRRSTDNGASWDPEQGILGGPGMGSNYGAAVAVNGPCVHVTSHNQWNAGNYEIYYNRSTDSGSTWDWNYYGQRLTNDAAGSSESDIGVSPNYDFPHVVWTDDRDGNNEIYTKHKSVIPDIRIDGQDGPLNISSSQSIALTIHLDPMSQAGANHDWWIVAEKAGGATFSWVYSIPWHWTPGVQRAHAGPLFSLATYPVHNGTIPVGTWRITFALDTLNNSYEQTHRDSIDVTSS